MVSGQDFLSTKISKEHAIEDFEYFKSALETGHPSLYWYNDSTKLQQEFRRVRNQLNQSISNKEFHALLAQIMQVVGDGHSGVFFPKYYRDYVDSINLYIPFNVKLIDNKIFVLKNLSDEEIADGSEIISINGTSADDIIQFLQCKISTDKGIVSKQMRFLELLFPYYFTFYYGVEPNYEIEYIAPNNSSTHIKNVKALPRKDQILKSGRQFSLNSVPLEFKIENPNTAYLKINTFEFLSFKKAGINFVDTLSQIFNKIDSLHIKNLILDLRENTGGSMKFGEALFSFFVDKPTKYFGPAKIKKTIADGNYKYSKVPRLKERFESMFSISEEGDFYTLQNSDSLFPKPYYFKGQLYILTSGRSFSSTACFIAQCKDKNKGILIGEVPGGAYTGLTTQPRIMMNLPNTQFELHFQATHISLDLNKSQVNIPVDYEVFPSINSILNEINVEKEYALKLISNQ